MTSEERMQIAARYEAGERGTRLAQECGVSPDRVRKWAKWYRENPGQLPQQGGSRNKGREPWNKTPESERLLIRRLRADGWTLEQIEVRTGKSYKAIWRALKEGQ